MRRAELTRLIGLRPTYKHAWDIGQRLRIIEDLARTGHDVREMSSVLGIDSDTLRAEIERDPDLHQAMVRGRAATAKLVREALIAAATSMPNNDQGKYVFDIKAAQQVLEMLSRDLAGTQINFHALTVNQAAEALGVTRQTLHEWKTAKDCPKNADGSFNLTRLIDWRLAELVARHPASKSAAGGESDAGERFRLAKARGEEMKVAQKRGELVAISSVAAGLVGRWTRLCTLLEGKPASLTAVLVSAPPDLMHARLQEFCEELRRLMCDVPQEWMLPPLLAAELQGLLTRHLPPMR